MNPNAIRVPLSQQDWRYCCHMGIERNLSAYERGLKVEPGNDRMAFEDHILGVAGEFVVARAFGLPYKPAIGVLDTATGDVGGLQVKAITVPTFSLIVRKSDPTNRPYLLAFLTYKFGLVLGWIEGEKTHNTELYWREQNKALGIHRAAFFIPQMALHRSFDEIRKRLNQPVPPSTPASQSLPGLESVTLTPPN